MLSVQKKYDVQRRDTEYLANITLPSREYIDNQNMLFDNVDMHILDAPRKGDALYKWFRDYERYRKPLEPIVKEEIITSHVRYAVVTFLKNNDGCALRSIVFDANKTYSERTKMFIFMQTIRFNNIAFLRDFISPKHNTLPENVIQAGFRLALMTDYTTRNGLSESTGCVCVLYTLLMRTHASASLRTNMKPNLFSNFSFSHCDIGKSSSYLAKAVWFCIENQRLYSYSFFGNINAKETLIQTIMWWEHASMQLRSKVCEGVSSISIQIDSISFECSNQLSLCIGSFTAIEVIKSEVRRHSLVMYEDKDTWTPCLQEEKAKGKMKKK